MKSIALWPAAGAEESEAGGMDEGTGVDEPRAGTVSSSTVERGCTRRDTNEIERSAPQFAAVERRILSIRLR
jgi:hypothetical protein